MPSSDSQKPIDLVDQTRPATSRNFEAKRNTRVDANAAFSITDEILDRHLNDFEEPRGEGEEDHLGRDAASGALRKRLSSGSVGMTVYYDPAHRW